MADKEIMLGVPDDEEEMIELQEHRAIVTLPENSVSVEIQAKVYQDGELVNVSKTLSMEDIRTAFRKADDGYIDEDDRFVITEKGLEWLEEQEKKGQ